MLSNQVQVISPEIADAPVPALALLDAIGRVVAMLATNKIAAGEDIFIDGGRVQLSDAVLVNAQQILLGGGLKLSQDSSGLNLSGLLTLTQILSDRGFSLLAVDSLGRVGAGIENAVLSKTADGLNLSGIATLDRPASESGLDFALTDRLGRVGAGLGGGATLRKSGKTLDLSGMMKLEFISAELPLTHVHIDRLGRVGYGAGPNIITAATNAG